MDLLVLFLKIPQTSRKMYIVRHNEDGGRRSFSFINVFWKMAATFYSQSIRGNLVAFLCSDLSILFFFANRIKTRNSLFRFIRESL